jgi:hypothetical protein
MLRKVGRFLGRHAPTARLTAYPAGLGWTLAGLLAFAPHRANADEAATVAQMEQAANPPTTERPRLQYGIAFTIEDVVAPGPICEPGDPCILGSGGGVLVRVGWRPSERLYVGGAYELSKQEPDKLYRLGILQQARGEARRYFPTGHSTTPFVLLGAGLAGYGDEWAVDTWGPSLMLGAGLEVEVSAALLFDFSLAYRPVYLQHYVDSSTLSHGAGVAQLFVVELAIEATEAL